MVVTILFHVSSWKPEGSAVVMDLGSSLIDTHLMFQEGQARGDTMNQRFELKIRNTRAESQMSEQGSLGRKWASLPRRDPGKMIFQSLLSKQRGKGMPSVAKLHWI